MTTGYPAINFYASNPLTSAVVPQHLGLRLGPRQPGKTKYLKELSSGVQATNNTCWSTFLVDLLLYYPFIDGTVTDPQPFENPVTLPRFTDGDQLSMFVVAQGAYVGGATFQVKYTNQNGVSGRITRTVTSNTTGTLGTIINSGATTQSPIFLPLERGDTGVRSVEEFTFNTENGGIFALVICKVIAIGPLVEGDINMTSEKDFLASSLNMPEIHEDSCLSFLTISATGGAQRYGHQAKFVWG
jgi:hypothetical protein